MKLTPTVVDSCHIFSCHCMAIFTVWVGTVSSLVPPMHTVTFTHIPTITLNSEILAKILFSRIEVKDIFET